ncbi:VP5 [Mycoreovirus 1]|uniref:Uncharacterized protein VP5 n=1 Tax=Cryphonectria parasitica mycoreovirus 1 (strain 9B21) TaxID=230407 RepID=VP5_MYRV9|nr:VP5 [Mycoreovirus 1]Q65YV1.1 RecName: Full=Uncharacterized protein VP5 [Cryphonectria parasitica mycoreovirus 1]BAD51415.1 VP5 [Cryphonectria parasitica mycoreovirus 1]
MSYITIIVISSDRPTPIHLSGIHSSCEVQSYTSVRSTVSVHHQEVEARPDCQIKSQYSDVVPIIANSLAEDNCNLMHDRIAYQLSELCASKRLDECITKLADLVPRHIDLLSAMPTLANLNPSFQRVHELLMDYSGQIMHVQQTISNLANPSKHVDFNTAVEILKSRMVERENAIERIQAIESVPLSHRVMEGTARHDLMKYKHADFRVTLPFSAPTSDWSSTEELRSDVHLVSDVNTCRNTDYGVIYKANPTHVEHVIWMSRQPLQIVDKSMTDTYFDEYLGAFRIICGDNVFHLHRHVAYNQNSQVIGVVLEGSPYLLRAIFRDLPRTLMTSFVFLTAVTPLPDQLLSFPYGGYIHTIVDSTAPLSHPLHPLTPSAETVCFYFSQLCHMGREHILSGEEIECVLPSGEVSTALYRLLTLINLDDSKRYVMTKRPYNVPNPVRHTIDVFLHDHGFHDVADALSEIGYMYATQKISCLLPTAITDIEGISPLAQVLLSLRVRCKNGVTKFGHTRLGQMSGLCKHGTPRNITQMMFISDDQTTEFFCPACGTVYETAFERQLCNVIDYMCVYNVPFDDGIFVMSPYYALNPKKSDPSTLKIVSSNIGYGAYPGIAMLGECYDAAIPPDFDTKTLSFARFRRATGGMML